MNASSRSIEIVRLLMHEAKTQGELAEAIGVSTKTISRELPHVEALLGRYGMKLARRSGTGLSVEGNAEGKQKLAEEMLRQEVQSSYTPEERRSIIISQLLKSKEPIKLFSLASKLRVTDGTISNDLDKLDMWFREHRLQLVRKPGLGISLSGTERDIRRAMVHYIYENIDEGELLHLVQENLQADSEGKAGRAAASDYLLDLVDRTIIRTLEKLLHAMERTMGYQLSDHALIGLVVHLSLAVQRIRKQEDIKIDPAFLEELRSKREFSQAAEIAAHMEEIFDISVPEDEIGYITMHLLGARNRFREQAMGSVSVMDNYHLVKLAKSIMRTAAKETGSNIERSQSLLAGLVNHLGPSISRIRMHMDIRNPLLAEMKEHYPELMELASKCVADLEKELQTELPESEIAYIAMHLGAALAEVKPFRSVEHRIAVACPTGMGTSRLLASRIRQQYPNLRVVDQVSTLAVNADDTARMEVEFIVSTVPIAHAPVPVVVVSALMNGADCQRLEQEIARQNESFLRKAAEDRPKPPFTEALCRMADYSGAILSLLEHFFFWEEELPDIMAACRAAGRLAADDPGAQEGIAQGLMAREEQGNTVITGSHMALLHCKSRFVSCLSVGILHFGTGFAYPEGGELIRTAIVLLAPEDSSPCDLETAGCLASVLLDRWGLMEVLHAGDEEQIRQELVGIFRDFYRQKYQEMFGA